MEELVCAKCFKYFEEDSPPIDAIGKVFHRQCYVCHRCSKDLEAANYYSDSEKLFCPECKAAVAMPLKHSTEFNTFQIAPECPKCSKPISSGYVGAFQRQYHPACFLCFKCGKQLKPPAFEPFNDKPYCEKCILIVNPPHQIKARTVEHDLFST